MKGIRLTKRTVKAATYEGPGGDFRWDSEIAGFGLRVYPSGRKAYVVTYRVRGKQRFYTVGRFGEMTVKEARAEALEKLARARKGEDPSRDRLATHRAPKMTDLAERYMKEHARVRMKPGGAHGDQLIWDRRILPRFGRRKVADITRSDVAEWHAELAPTPMMANRIRGILSKAFNLAEVWGWRPEGTNPCRHVKRYREEARERYLSEKELIRLGRVLVEAEKSWGVAPQAVAAIRLLILTGCRSAEILKLRWEHVDFERHCLHLPDSKTGKKTVRLNTAALQVLSEVERIDGNPYVIPGSKPGAPRQSLQGLWERICREAELTGVRIHDLRHTFASTGVNAGLTLPVIGQLLGHTQVSTTARYSHLADDPVRQANEVIGTTLEATLSGKPKAAVVSMSERKKAL